MARLLKIGMILAFACAALVYPAVWVLDATATDVYLIKPKPQNMVEFESETFASTNDPSSAAYRKEVIFIYGTGTNEPIRVLFVDKSRLRVPKQLPSITLLELDFNKDPSPFQVQSFYYFAKYVAGGAAAVGILLLILWRLAARPKAAAPPAA